MENNEYRNTLIEGVDLLDKMQGELFNAIVNVGMYGVFKEVNNSFETNDRFKFELAMFEGNDDTNLKELIKLYKAVKQCQEDILINNQIGDEELPG
jgi:hypothetical protein